MKKTNLFRAPAFFLLAVLFCSCGLESYYTLDPPITAYHAPTYNNSDKAQNYFDFVSAVNSNTDSSFRFLGTAVYYRIYTDVSTMTSRQSSISAVNTSSDYSAAASRMIGYGYQQLNTTAGSVQPLISAQGVRVKIRLTNNGESESLTDIENMAQITVLGRTPSRAVGASKSFDFGRYGKPDYTPSENYTPPASGDEDFAGGEAANNMYYVDMYAVAVGRDTTYTTYYSNVLYLGSVAIDASAENN